MDYQLGIIGGVGSEASAYFYNKLIQHTKACCDQDHLNIIVLNHAAIPDRTTYIMDPTKTNPLPAFLEDIQLLNQLQVKLIMIPCNTSFYFYEEYAKHSQVPIYHLVEETMRQLQKEGIKSVGVLATDGTIHAQLYQKACQKFGVQCLLPSAKGQQNVMTLIYSYLKKGVPIDTALFEQIVTEMKVQQAERVILACTELSLLKEKQQLSDFFCDPLDMAVTYALQYFHKQQK